MIEKEKRVNRALFLATSRGGRVFDSAHLVLRVFPSLKDGKNRFSFVVPKAVSKKAVERNLLRRRGYVAVARVENNLKKKTINIFFFKKGSGNISYQLILEEITGLFSKAGLL